jgi:hypothetical protein
MTRKKKKNGKNASCDNNHQLSTQRYEPSTITHLERKSLTAVVAFGTAIANRPSIITLFGCFRCLDFRTKDLLLYMHTSTSEQLALFHRFQVQISGGRPFELIFVFMVYSSLSTLKALPKNAKTCIMLTRVFYSRRHKTNY